MCLHRESDADSNDAFPCYPYRKYAARTNGLRIVTAECGLGYTDVMQSDYLKLQ